MQRIAASSARRIVRLVASSVALLLSAPGAWAASTEISNVPLFTSSATAVKPNLLFVLDDSGSMGWEYLPDEAGAFFPSRFDSTNRYGRWASQCNAVAYNPATTYQRPVDAAGNQYPNASVTAAWVDGFDTAAGTVDLSTAYYYTYSGSQPKISFYRNGVFDNTTTFYSECLSAIGSTPGSNVFTRVNVSSLTSAQKQNYANWYAYYRTRMQMMKSSVGLAFKPIDSQFRVGFTTISDSTVTSTGFVNVGNFDTTQKTTFYSALYGSTPGGRTPLRGALSKAGQYFAKKASGQTADPVQYSCQKNFTLLSTDGYWNAGDESTTYGPFKLDNATSVGQQDGGAARPLYDGAVATTKVTTTWNETDTWQTTVIQPKKTTQLTTSTYTVTSTTPQSRTNYTLGSVTSSAYRISAASRSCGSSTCTIQIDTSSSHPFQNNDSITITNVSPSNYNGTFSPITRVSSTRFTFVIPRPSGGLSNGTVNSSSAAQEIFGGCTTAGQGKVTSQPQSQTLTVITPYKTDTTTTKTWDVTTVTQSVTTTPYTKVVTTINGVTQPAVITAGTPSTVTSPVSTANSTVATDVQSVGPAAGTPSSSATGWANSGASSVLSGCYSAAPPASSAINGSTVTGAPSSPPVVVTGATSAVTNNGTGSTSNSTAVHAKGAESAPTSDTTYSGGSSDSLADIAMYYYMTDLRDTSLGNCTGALGTGTNVCTNNVDPKGTDTAITQHMTTYTLGLGVPGTLTYQKDYGSPAVTSGDFYDISQGTKNWPLPGDGKGGENIDDLWHAAVDGRGRYFSAGEPTELAKSLADSLTQISAQVGSGSAAATTTLRPVAGNNAVFVGKYFTESWHGDLDKYTIDPATGTLTKSTDSALAILNARVQAGTPARSIYYFKPGTGNTGTLRAMTYANLTTDSLNGNLDGACSTKSPALTQCSTLTATEQTTANSGSNLLSWFIGGDNSVFRDRPNKLGDLGNASPVVVSQPPFKYTEHAYQDFVSAKASRTSMVYVAANDGMLHAFDAQTLQEKWAYVPTPMLSKLYRLADSNYAKNHQYYVDATPVMGDIYVGGAWKTILVGGFGAGGRGYYALDITDPAAPAALWEFNDTDMGLSYGNPIITKRADGTWVVVFASGYNNNVAGDGNGHLYVVNANTGAQLLKLDTLVGTTPVGTVGTPSGLAKINDWVDSDAENLAKRFYGGDLLGNLWRFDIDSVTAPYQSAMRLAQLKVGSVVQPITTQPQLAEVTYSGTKYPVVYVATGRYLGTGDLSNTDQQTIYGLKDTLSSSGLGDVHASTSIVDQAVTTSGNLRKADRSTVNWATKVGWKLDLPSSGERVNIDMQLQLNVLSVASNIPSTDACTSGGQSWLYELDIASGGALQGATGDVSGGYQVGHWLGNATTVGLTSVQLQNGALLTIGTNAKGELFTSTPQLPTSGTGATRRSSWRELAN